MTMHTCRLLSLVGLSFTSALFGADASDAELDRRFTQTVRPFVDQYCASCHSGKTPAAQLDLESFPNTASVVKDFPHWNLLLERLTAQEMPPKGLPQPPTDRRQQVMGWIKDVRSREMTRNAGDPGPVLARRLSNSEYSYTIRDLTGVDLKPTREFPVDPANQSGFDNSGESLNMSPALLNKYLQAAREVGDHMVLTPEGFNFSATPMLVATDRDKYAIQRILDFYESQPTDYAAYFEAAWRYKHRTALGKQGATLASTATAAKVSPKYLPLIWDILGETPRQNKIEEVGPIAKLQGMWRTLPNPPADQELVHALCIQMRDFVVKIRQHTAMQFAAPLVKGLPAASQPLLGWKFTQYNTHRREFDPVALRSSADPEPALPEIPKYAGLHAEAAPRWAALTAHARAGDLDLIIPAAERPRYEDSFKRFATVFPDTFYVKERGKFFPDDSADQGRLLSAGYHSVMGYWRDDTPLMELILDDKAQKELNHLWLEFDFMADHTARTWVQYYFNQSGEVETGRAESGRPRPQGKEVTDASIVTQFRDLYIAKALASDNPLAAGWMPNHFDRINATMRSLEKMRIEAEPVQVEALVKFATKAYRRPLAKAEQDDLRTYYRSLREKGGLAHEDAMRDSVVSILISPDFCYRLELTSGRAPARTSAASPLSNYELANRLSYFLWSSMPDRELLDHAAAGDLQRKEVLTAQARRMLKDERARGLATEFAGNWLDFRRFESHNAVDRGRFPTFNDDLREAMFQEPIRFIEDVIRNGSSVLDMLYGNYTFVNPVLAKHYGIPNVTGGNDHWMRIDDAGRYERGGLLPMSVFLTQNSPGLRTSPVKRGYWVVRRVLGEVIPPPPPVVPELPHDEAKTELPLREVLAQHRANPVCSGCHARFDVFGLAFEGYGPVGETRSKDLAGRPVDVTATFPGGSQGAGFRGVQTYIRERRQKDFVDNLSRKLLAYGLGRSLQLSDDAVVENMQARLAANNFRFASLVETLITSPQFLNKRNPESARSSD